MWTVSITLLNAPWWPTSAGSSASVFRISGGSKACSWKPAPGAILTRLLGLSPQASDAEVKAAYRKLLRENHPDRVTAQGLPEEFIEVANRKMAEINAAHDRIKAERGLN